MKNWLYLPFLVLMAVTYTRLVKNFENGQTLNAAVRAPASVEVEIIAECHDLPGEFNPHFKSQSCL